MDIPKHTLTVAVREIAIIDSSGGRVHPLRD